MRKPVGMRRSRWWGLPREARSSRAAFLRWSINELTKCMDAGISLPARAWFSFKEEC